MAKETTMMEQYLGIKEKYKHCLLLFRLGDFYELFFEDAKIISERLGLVLTKRSYGNGQIAPMCGVPHHSYKGYVSKMLYEGYKVAICEQVEDAKYSKGIVKREVIRVISPGTAIDEFSLDETKNNYICCIYTDKMGYGISFADVSTGEFKCCDIVPASINKLFDEIDSYYPSEILINESSSNDKLISTLKERYSALPEKHNEWSYGYESANALLCNHFNVLTMDGYGLKESKHALCSSGALLSYLIDTQKNSLNQINQIKYYSSNEYLTIDSSTRRNLELTQTMIDKSKKGSLLWTLDYTKTSMGARLLRRWIEQPLANSSEIKKRLDTVGEMKDNMIIRSDIRDILSNMYDIERILTRLIYKNIDGRDLISLKISIEKIPELKRYLESFSSSYFKVISEEMDDLTDLYSLIESSISDEPPVGIKDGGIIKGGYNKDVDIYHETKQLGQSWIASFEEREREKTSIKNLRINYNKVFGYYIEVTKSNIVNVPDTYKRKQTLSNCERYTTDELEEIQQKVLGANELLNDLEYNLFCNIRDTISENSKRIQKTAQIVAIVDIVQSLAEAAYIQNFTKPEITDESIIEITDGRHPVIEKISNHQFIPNDTYLDDEENRLLIITGPNMAGKSTYMRQTALIVLMAQMGSFVPAEYCRLGVVDRIFTRVGASDDLAAGQSTFMVEMAEVANILNNATKSSLIILDEIGRGTSTFDGLSIAWAVVEHISDKNFLGAKTLFATHYHELTELEGKLPGVKNFCILIQESEDGILFLRKIKRGGAQYSLGVAVAKLAGIPDSVVRRSNDILNELNEADITKKAKKIAEHSAESIATNIEYELKSIKRKEDIKEQSNIIASIIDMDINSMSPIEALTELYNIQSKVKKLHD